MRVSMNLHSAQRLERRLINRRIPYANPRIHSDAHVAQIAASISKFGFDKSIFVATKSGIIAGHEAAVSGRFRG